MEREDSKKMLKMPIIDDESYYFLLSLNKVFEYIFVNKEGLIILSQAKPMRLNGDKWNILSFGHTYTFIVRGLINSNFEWLKWENEPLEIKDLIELNYEYRMKHYCCGGE